MTDEQPTRGPGAAGETAPHLGRFAAVEMRERTPVGDTYRARDPQSGRMVRVRHVHAHHAADHAEQARQARERMAHERHVAGLFAGSHPHIVAVLDHEVMPDGTHLLVSEDVPGGTLREQLAEESLPLDAALAVAADVSAALAAANERGVIHRNLKPANIWLTNDGRAKVADFGLAQVGGDHPAGVAHPLTPLYASPEQETTTTPLGPASDQYALGLVLFEMLTGAKYRRMEPAQAGDLLAPFPDEVRSLVTRMLATQPIDRHRSLGAVAAEIARLRGVEVAAAVTPGKEADVSRMGEPVPDYARNAAPPPRPEMAPAVGDVHRMAEPMPAAPPVAPAHPPPPTGTTPGKMGDVHRMAEPLPDAATPAKGAGATAAARRFGPKRGLLQPPVGAFAATYAGLTLRDGTVSARFLNPGDAATSAWTAGFAFRVAADGSRYLCGVNARGEWFFSASRDEAGNGLAPWETGKNDAVRTAEDDINTLALTLTGDDAHLAVNDAPVAAVRLAAFAPFVANAAGDVALVARCESADGDTSVLYDRFVVTLGN